NLSNINKLTFLVTLNCLNGMFAGPGEGLLIPNTQPPQYNPISLSESFLKSSLGGAVAAFSPSGQGYSSYHVPLAQEIYQTIFSTSPPPPPPGTPLPPQPVLGLAIQQAEKNILTNSPAFLETISLFVLLGDPATQLAIP
ncbi:MAG: C25 family cysteine peptidase, partial [Nitrospiria bacterium]